jgi:putative (di)nucleoside polyphosphate hydrolase
MYRKGVSTLIINRKKEFLLVNLETFEEDEYAIPGGGIEEEESLEDAAYREIYEEVGIQRTSLELVGIGTKPIMYNFRSKLVRNGIEYTGSLRNFLGFLFVGSDEDILTKKGEVRTSKWVSFSELDKYLLFDLQLEETTEQIREIFPDIVI